MEDVEDFDFLKGVDGGDARERVFRCHMLEPMGFAKYAASVYEQVLGGNLRDPGEAVFEAYNRRGLTFNESFFAYHFYFVDSNYSFECARGIFDYTFSEDVGILEGGDLPIPSVGVLIRRAREGVSRGRNFEDYSSSGVIWDMDSFLDDINLLENKLKVVSSYPNCCIEILNAMRSMSECVAADDYESAVCYRDKIRKLKCET